MKDAVDSTSHRIDDKTLAQNANEAFRARRLDTAIKMYTQAIKINKTEWKRYSNRSAAFLAKGACKRALRDSEKCIEIAPDNAKGYIRQACAHVGMRNYGEAIASFMVGLGFEAQNQVLKDALKEARLRNNQKMLSDFSVFQKATMTVFAQVEQRRRTAKKLEVRYLYGK